MTEGNQKNLETIASLRYVWVGGWGGGGGGLGVIVVRECEPVFRNLPYSYTWTLKTKKDGPMHILDRLKCVPIHILLLDFLYLFIAGSLKNIAVNS